MIDSYSIIYTHVARTLPDSLTERKQLLHALEAVLRDTHPAKRLVRSQLTAILKIEETQRELPLAFTDHTLSHNSK